MRPSATTNIYSCSQQVMTAMSDDLVNGVEKAEKIAHVVVVSLHVLHSAFAHETVLQDDAVCRRYLQLSIASLSSQVRQLPSKTR
jgi:hypothetical protein